MRQYRSDIDFLGYKTRPLQNPISLSDTERCDERCARCLEDRGWLAQNIHN